MVWAWFPSPVSLVSGLPALGSHQQAVPLFLLPISFLQSSESHFGSFSEDVLHVFSKLGRTFQVECSLDLFTGTQALDGGRESIR
jgi:hypothetical protein